MTRIAHISDLHLLEENLQSRCLADRLRLAFLSFGRPLDPTWRLRAAKRALRRALALHPDHVVVSGDLTEDGTPAQFEALARALSEADVDPTRVTLVPGNHDAYTSSDGFLKALSGPLRDYAATSTPGAVVLLSGVAVVAVSTAVHQSALRSAGAVNDEEVKAVSMLLGWSALREQNVVLAMHHPPLRCLLAPWQWVDGLVNLSAIEQLFSREPRLHALCGHAHRRGDRSVNGTDDVQVHIAPAVVDHPDPVRAYTVVRGRLEALEQHIHPRLLPAAAT